MKKLILFISFITILIFSLSSCSIFGSREYGYITEDIEGTEFYKRKTDYELEAGQNYYKTLTCYYKEKEDICYVSVLDLFNIFKDNLSSDGSVFDNFISNEVVTISFNGQNNTKEYITLDSKDNSVYISSASFYSFLFNGEGLTKEKEYVKNQYAYNHISDSFNLSNYSLTSYYIDNQVILPLSIFQLIYTQEIGYNFYYVNGKIHGTYLGTYNYEGSSLKNESEAMKDLNYNYLKLFLNKYYGLANYKGLNDLSKVNTLLSTYKEDLHSTTKKIEQAESSILDTALNDLHTGINNYSIFHSSNYELNIVNPDKYISLKNSLDLYDQMYNSTKDNMFKNYTTLYDIDSKTELGRVYQNSAYLKFNEFNFTSKDDYIDSSKINSDTYTFMYQALKTLNSNYSNVKNIVIDLTENTGGAVISGLELLSFMTNDKIVWTYTTLNGEYAYEEVEVDNDFDLDTTDFDAPTNYNFYIEISDVSFSCANFVPFIAKEYNLAKIIGITSAGGMCVVDYAVLPDGTYIQYSSPIQLNSGANGISSRSCEDGVVPDISLNKTNLYNYQYINSILK